MDAVNLHWREQYYLNDGYDISLGDEPIGHASEAQFPLRSLDPTNNYTARVRTAWDDGKSSPRAAEIKFSLASLLPAEVSLTELEPLKSNGRWRGFEADESLPGAPLSVHGRSYRGLSSFANSETDYDLKALFTNFSGAVAVDGEARGDASLDFAILGDGRELWRGAVKPGDDPKPIHLDITGVRKLTLRSHGPERRSRLQADWIDPKLERQP